MLRNTVTVVSVVTGIQLIEDVNRCKLSFVPLMYFLLKKCSVYLFPRWLPRTPCDLVALPLELSLPAYHRSTWCQQPLLLQVTSSWFLRNSLLCTCNPSAESGSMSEYMPSSITSSASEMSLNKFRSMSQGHTPCHQVLSTRGLCLHNEQCRNTDDIFNMIKILTVGGIFKNIKLDFLPNLDSFNACKQYWHEM